MKKFAKEINFKEFALRKYREHIKDNNYVFPKNLIIPEYNLLTIHQWMNIDDLKIYEECQRHRVEGYNNKRVLNICNPETFDWSKFMPIIVCTIKGDNVVVDGFGRLLGCLPLGMKKVPVHQYFYDDYESVFNHFTYLHRNDIVSAPKPFDDFFTKTSQGDSNCMALKNEICKNFEFTEEKSNLTPKNKAVHIFTKADWGGIIWQVHGEYIKHLPKISKILNAYAKIRRTFNNDLPIKDYNVVLNNIFTRINSLIKEGKLDKNCDLTNLLDDNKLDKFNSKKFMYDSNNSANIDRFINAKYKKNNDMETSYRAALILELINKAKICNDAWLIKTESNKKVNMLKVLINDIKNK